MVLESVVEQIIYSFTHQQHAQPDTAPDTWSYAAEPVDRWAEIEVCETSRGRRQSLPSGIGNRLLTKA